MRNPPAAPEKLGSLDQYERGLATPAGYEAELYYDEGSWTQSQGLGMSDHLRLTGPRRGGVLLALTLVGCVILAGAAAYSFGNYYASSAPSGSHLVADTPLNAGPAIAPQAAGKVSENPAWTPGWDSEFNSLPGWLTPSPLSSTAKPEPFGSNAPEPKPVRTLTIRSDANDPKGVPSDVPSFASAPDGTSKETQGSTLSLDPQQPEKAPSALQATGGYVVQVSAQRSEARAQASFRLMQSKYPSGFKDRSPIIKRSDLGAKGVIYRAQVGPFASAADAVQFCSGLKAAGGECVVQKN